MALASVATLLDRIDVPGCTDALALEQLRLAAEEFFRRSEAWRETLPAMATTAGQAAYPLAVPPEYDATVLRVTGASLDGSPIKRADYDVSGDGVLTLASTPARSGLTLEASVAFLPGLTCQSYPDRLLRRWQVAIVKGAKGKAWLAAPEKFRNPELAAPELRDFDRLIGDAMAEVLKGNKAGPVMIPMRKFI